MPLIAVRVKADLENVRSITFPENNLWCFDVKESNGEEVREKVTMITDEMFDLTNSRGTAHFIIKWDGSKHQSTINIEQLKGVSNTYEEDNSGTFKTVTVLDCRGVEPIKCHPRGGVQVITTAGAILEDIQLNEDWYDVCPKTSTPVQIENLEFEFKVHR
eukprot:GHVR01119653.1.p1 GENE.GHVR01119653.1~~GHVR01119653.1.p1  ORF type:complete len:171 (+),score=35.73 GHVR01119653.1:35-514(+)